MNNDIMFAIDDDKLSILKSVIEKNGCQYQEDVAIEEMSELIKELVKRRRHSIATAKEDEEHIKCISSEIADVIIMMIQLSMIYPENIIRDQIDFKLQRLEKRLRNEA